jgi:hypothetical protein
MCLLLHTADKLNDTKKLNSWHQCNTCNKMGISITATFTQCITSKHWSNLLLYKLVLCQNVYIRLISRPQFKQLNQANIQGEAQVKQSQWFHYNTKVGV